MAQFTKGNPGGPGGPRPGAGRKPASTREVSRRLFDGVPEEDMAEIIASTVAAAKGGDASARNWLFDSVFGRPSATDALAQQEELREEQERFHAALLAALSEIDPSLAGRVHERLAAFGIDADDSV